MSLSKNGCPIRVLKLSDGEHNDGVLYRLQNGWIVHFVLGPTLASKSVLVYTNIPKIGDNFDRSKYQLLNWNKYCNSSSDKLELYASVTLHLAGAFQYYFCCDGKKSGSGFLLVDPTLKVGRDNQIVPLDAVCMQTILPKLLGKFSQWKERLLVSKESGYNVIHFTPIQKLGISNSSYSLADQLSLNPNFSDEKTIVTFNDIKNLVSDMCQNWGILSVTDVVWNHTAKNSIWLKVNPECAYNLHNSPYLRPAYIFDRAIFHLGLDIANGKYVEYFKNHEITTYNDLENLRKVLETKIIPSLRLHEFFQVNVEKEQKKFKKALSSKQFSSDSTTNQTINIIQSEDYHRYGCTVDIDVAVKQFSNVNGSDISESLKAFTHTITWLNNSQKEMFEKDIKSAINNIISTVQYERLADHGPKLKLLDADHPLVTCYFVHPFDTSLVEEKLIDDKSKAKLIMACNGWVMGNDALKNFADPPGRVYLFRELICWGDSVKLRYGSKPADCPALWQRMKKYTEMMAEIFHGIRIDNCHSTPIHVAEFMLDAARRVNPNLYVFAELFTGSEYVDNVFVNRLGLTSLIREALTAWDAQELGRLVYLYGGESIASFKKPLLQDLKPSRAHALFYDITHDNESMISKRSIHDLVPSSALVAMSSCAIGSNRGHDEMVPHHIHVVTEQRFYKKWQSMSQSSNLQVVGSNAGMIKVKLLLNTLHQTLAMHGFNQVFVDQRTSDVVAVTRHNPTNHDSYILVAYTSFKDLSSTKISSLSVEGCVTGVAFEVKPKQPDNQTSVYTKPFIKDSSFLNGIEGYNLCIKTNIQVSQSTCCKISNAIDGKNDVVNFTEFQPGSILVLQVKMNPSAADSIANYRRIVTSLSHNNNSEFDSVITALNLMSLNRVLYHCDEEEQSDGLGTGVYDFPNLGKLSYCGIAGIAVHLRKISSANDLGHPICSNLREGNWLLDYISSRLEQHKETRAIGKWYSECFNVLKKIPRFLIPTYFEMVISLTYEKLLNACWKKMSNFVKNGSTFVRQLALGTVAMCGFIKGANLPLLHPSIGVNYNEDSSVQVCLSMAAGLPHFSSGVMRCWGRDTFIAMHGLQLLTGQYSDARNLILAFAGCLRHGLIPNLLGEGKISRYNCRDAVWFWLQCIQDLCKLDSYDLLQLSVARIFPTDESKPCTLGEVTQPLYCVMQEALQKHVNGIHYKERNAGLNLDMNMSDKGFYVDAGVDLKTGFVFGGNEYNCGTWMDKMGESVKAGTKGIPATPRDGSAIELIGLCKSTVSWLYQAYSSGKYPFDGVICHDGSKFTWKEWENKISENFEKLFYVSESDHSHLVHKRFIYKDCFNSTKPWCDYQLRPNFSIAMVYAPELFDPQKAWKALEIAQKHLLGPLGMKTLDPDDIQYRGDYDNSNDTDDASVAKGFNYHQGPEWLWPVGYFLRAKLYFAKKISSEKLKETVQFIQSYVVSHHLHLDESTWSGLPELTNSNGKFCKDSCPIQAWSHATFLDLMYDLSQVDV